MCVWHCDTQFSFELNCVALFTLTRHADTADIATVCVASKPP